MNPKQTPALTQERLKHLFTYDPMTGFLTRRVKSKNGHKAGTVASARDVDGYVIVGIDGRTYFAHRLAWLYMFGAFPAGEIDHKNHIHDDNRLSNLRDVSTSRNQQNRIKAQANNRTSGLLGVSWHKDNKRWRATIHINGRQRLVGQFDSAQEAHVAYIQAKRESHECCTI
jgi:hypothetical protein